MPRPRSQKRRVGIVGGGDERDHSGLRIRKATNYSDVGPRLGEDVQSITKGVPMGSRRRSERPRKGQECRSQRRGAFPEFNPDKYFYYCRNRKKRCAGELPGLMKMKRYCIIRDGIGCKHLGKRPLTETVHRANERRERRNFNRVALRFYMYGIPARVAARAALPARRW